jgi:hypothetical protein
VRRIRASRRTGISLRHEVGFLTLLTIGLSVLTLGTATVIFSTTEPDISDLSPVFAKTGDDFTILNWVELERRRRALQQGTTVFNGARIQALGYMAEEDWPVPTGKSVRDFVLLPEAGNLLHGAHRFGDQMIAVHLSANNEIKFIPGSLVWAKGILRASFGDPAGTKPLYELNEATVLRADKEDIKRYFH